MARLEPRGSVRGWTPYGYAIIVAALTIGLRLALRQVTDASLLILFIVPVILSAWFGGIGPAVLAASICCLSLPFVVFPKHGTPTIASTDDQIAAVIFILVALLTGSISGQLRRARDAAREAAARAERQAQRAQALANGSQRIAEDGLDVEGVLDAVARLTAEVMGDLCVVRLLDDDGQRLLPASVWHDDPAARQQAREALAREEESQDLGLSRVVLEGGGSLRVSDSPDAWSRVSPVHRPYVQQYGLHSIVLVPLQARGRTIGILSVSRESAGQPYSADDQAFLEELAHRAAVAIDNARLYDALQHSEERYRVVSELSSDYAYAFRLTSDGRLEREWTTAAFTRMTGYTPEELDERGWETLEHPDDREPLSGHLNLLLDGQQHTRQTRIVTKAGTIRWIEDQVQPIIDSDGQLVRVYGAAKDITQHKEVQRLQREFLALVTHELKGPLTSLRGYAQLMRRRGAYDAHGIETIINQSTHLERLINDLLDAVRVEAGRLNLRPRTIDLGAQVRSCVEQTQAATPTHVIDVSTPFEPLDGFWDPDRIDQIVLNLLSNAIKYSPDNSRIIVTVEDAGDLARLTVTDHGYGIPADDIPRLFERFFRVDSTRDYSQGIGLGLYITRSLVEAHGGWIDVESTLSEGSIFTVTLPKQMAEQTDDVSRRERSLA